MTSSHLLGLVLGIGLAGCARTVPTRAWVPPAGLAGPASCPVGYDHLGREDMVGTRSLSDLSVASLWVERPGGASEEGWIRLRPFADPCRHGDLRWSRVRLESAFDTLEFDRDDVSPLVEIFPHGPWGDPDITFRQVNEPAGMVRLVCESLRPEYGIHSGAPLAFRACMDPEARSFARCEP